MVPLIYNLSLSFVVHTSVSTMESSAVSRIYPMLEYRHNNVSVSNSTMWTWNILRQYHTVLHPVCHWKLPKRIRADWVHPVRRHALNSYNRLCERISMHLWVTITNTRLNKVWLFCILVACLPGFFFNSTSESCQPCSLGYYQPENGTTVCLGCPTGKTTLLLNSTAESDCVGRFPVLVYHLQKAKEWTKMG